MKKIKHFDVNGLELNIGDTITTTKGDRFGRPKTGEIYAFDMWSTFPRARIKNVSHGGEPTSTILIKNAVKIAK